MQVTISDPTPAPEMPVMWAVAWQSRTGEWKLTGGLNEEGHRYIAAASPGSRLIKIDPSAPSFEPGPTEWVGSDKTKYSFDPTRPEWLDMMFDGEAPTTLCPNTRTDIGHLISALMTTWHAAKEGT